jgi:hypothetical protein
MSIIYQLRLVLCDISPLIWRRLLVRSDTSIARLHAVIQAVLGWSDTSLHRFVIHGKGYGIARLDGIGFADDPHRVCLGDFRLRVGERFRYEYDFTDGWALDLHLEQVLELDPKVIYPRCTAGRGLAPPEDCGGPSAYLAQLDRFEYDFREALVHLEAGLDASATGEHQDADDEDEIREALKAIADCAKFAPRPFRRRPVNAELRALADGGGA